MQEAKILEKITEKRKINIRWLEVAASLGIPTLEIEASEDVSINKDKVLDFLESIQRGYE